MKTEAFRNQAHELVDWIADYMDGVRDYPVKAQVKPGEVRAKLGHKPPLEGEDFSDVVDDFKTIILPGITHWQHPRFMAYFPANGTPESQLAEMLISALGVNAMLWETSPAATELEEEMMAWLGGMIGVPENWSGVIQDTASTATFCAVLAARERATDWKVNAQGLTAVAPLAFYTTAQSHSSIEKAVKMAGLGLSSIRHVPVDDELKILPAELQAMIEADKAAGVIPAGVIISVGSTGVGACDPVRAVAEITNQHNLYLHVDAAWAGSALVCPEYQHLIDGIELADSFVFNPHKWMGIQFDCSAHFVKDKSTLIRTLTILPEYLKTREGDTVTDYRDWGPQLGRRMRALKVWFVLRGQGVRAIQQRIRNHVQWAETLAQTIAETEGYKICSKPILSLFSFRYEPAGSADLDDLNQRLVHAINDAGFTYVTKTLLDGRPVIRLQIGQTNTTWDDVDAVWSHIKATAAAME